MELRRTFNTDEYNYDKSRPAYPKDLFEDIFDYVNLSENSNVLEIGIGTGQATLTFLNNGCNVTAVELGDKLASYCAQKFSHFDNFNIINTDFIEADLPEKSFDLIYSATAFHWIPKDSGYAKIKSLLKSDGVVALFWNHPFVSNETDKTNLASMAVYKKYRSNDKTPVEFDSIKCQEQINELKQYGFTNIKSKVYKRIRRLTSEEYISLIKTYSDHNALPKEVRKAFEKDMKKAIDDVGGVINIYDTIDLYLGRYYYEQNYGITD
ncbi:class I SAM-dependent methyltransferase [Ruminococcus sp.]